MRVHYALPIDQQSYPAIERLRSTGKLTRRPSQRLQHDRAPGTLFDLPPTTLSAPNDATLRVGDTYLLVPLYRLPGAEQCAVIAASPDYHQYEGLNGLSVLLRNPATDLPKAVEAVTAVAHSGRQPTRRASLVELDRLFLARWYADVVVLQCIGAHWFAVLYFELTCTQANEVTRATEIALDLGGAPLVSASNSSGEEITTASCKLPRQLSKLAWHLGEPEREILERVITGWHRKELQNLLTRLCREARIVYAEDLTYGDMFGAFIHTARRYGVLDFHEAWLHNRLQVCGIPLEKIDPTGTSQRCSSCKGHPYGHRVGDQFSCLRCGKTLNAHYNAARNIMRLGRAKAQR